MRGSLAVTCAVVACLARALLAQAPERHQHHPSAKNGELGEVSFANSGAAAAQVPFQRGLALLHSFEYDEAAEGFREAQRADPSFAMAFWGEAATYSHLLWGEDDPDAARRALVRLAPTTEARLARAGTPRERAYGAAIEALCADTDQSSRIRGFVDGMRKVSTTYPDDLDAAAFTSLALIFAAYDRTLSAEPRTTAYRDEAIALADSVFRRNPRHPGGAHYLIHATDNPASAARGLDAARRYAAIAPDAEHALHMPSHIFLQLGLWDDVVASNERALAASRAEVEARKLSTAALSFHALEWLHYGYLQQGRFRAARALIDTARQAVSQVDLSAPSYVDARYAVAELEFTFAAHTHDWSGAVCDKRSEPAAAVSTSDREQGFHAVATYQAAIAAVMCGRSDVSIDALRARATALPPADPRTPLAKAALLHARLLTATRTGALDDLDQLVAEASAPARPSTGPPPTLRTHELLGELCLKAGRPREAVAAYQRALQLTPKRSAALLGLARASRAAGDMHAAAETYRQLLANWHQADPEIPALAEVRAGAKSQ
jgi:tetratricopeptide (TPR) repeat protein